MTSITYAYNRFCTKRFRLPSEAQVADLERRIKIDFPDDYRRYVLDFNGGYFDDPVILPVTEECPREALASMYGIGASHGGAELGSDASLVVFDYNDPPLVLPIGSTSLGGLIVLVTELQYGQRGQILLKQAWGDFYYLADNIEEFFDLLHSQDAPPSE